MQIYVEMFESETLTSNRIEYNKKISNRIESNLTNIFRIESNQV